MVSLVVDKDVIVNDEEKEAVDQPSKEIVEIPTIIISGSTNMATTHLKPADKKLVKTNDGDDDDDHVDFGDLSAFDEMLLARFAVPNKEILVISSSELQKSLGHPSSSVLTPIATLSTQTP